MKGWYPPEVPNLTAVPGKLPKTNLKKKNYVLNIQVIPKTFLMLKFTETLHKQPQIIDLCLFVLRKNVFFEVVK